MLNESDAQQALESVRKAQAAYAILSAESGPVANGTRPLGQSVSADGSLDALPRPAETAAEPATQLPQTGDGALPAAAAAGFAAAAAACLAAIAARLRKAKDLR